MGHWGIGVGALFALVAVLLNLAGAEGALADACGTLDLAGAAEICVFHGRNFDVDVDAIAAGCGRADYEDERRPDASGAQSRGRCGFEAGAVLAVTLQEADQGDTTMVRETMVQAGENLTGLIGTEASGQKPKVHLRGIEEVVTDKGYHRGRDVVPREVFFLARRIQKVSESSLSQIQVPSLQRT